MPYGWHVHVASLETDRTGRAVETLLCIVSGSGIAHDKRSAEPSDDAMVYFTPLTNTPTTTQNVPLSSLMCCLACASAQMLLANSHEQQHGPNTTASSTQVIAWQLFNTTAFSTRGRHIVAWQVFNTTAFPTQGPQVVAWQVSNTTAFSTQGPQVVAWQVCNTTALSTLGPLVVA